jgi:predicted nucleic acid-binding protein
VQKWIAIPPTWLGIRRIGDIDPELGYLGAGEQEAIALALRQSADALLIDERIGRKEAERRNLRVVGTLAVLDEADREVLLNFEVALSRLRRTSFRLSPNLIKALSLRRQGRK